MKIVKPAVKAFDVLELLANVPNGYKFTQILQKLQLPKSTGHELLQTLLYRQFIQYHPNKKLYSLGHRLGAFGVIQPHFSTEMQQVVNLANRLNESINQSVRV